MAGLSFDSKSSNSAFLSAGIFSADSIADLVFSMCSSVIYECHRLGPCLRGFVSGSQGQAVLNYSGNFVGLWRAHKIKTKAFAEADKRSRSQTRAHGRARKCLTFMIPGWQKFDDHCHRGQ